MSKPHGTKEFWLAGLRAEGAALRAAVGQDGALRQPVPTCPEWTVADLVRHVGSTYWYVRTMVGRGATQRPEKRSADAPVPDEAELVGWWDEQHAQLLTTLDTADPALPVWNWAPQPKRAVFWHRRMAHETAIHRWDAQLATGLTDPIEPKLAADGVTEVLDTWLPAGMRKGPADRHGIVALRASDIGQVWYVRLRGAGVALLDTDTLLDDPDHHERTVATGTASDLMLALYGRVAFDVLDLAGDAGLLRALRTG
jgi:uncharacterized protein (TIGR03083 family)